jgi:hypothetical protein
MGAELGGSGFEGVPGPCRLVEEEQEDGLVGKVPVRLSLAKASLQIASNFEGQIDFFF